MSDQRPYDPQPPDDLGEALTLLATEWGPSDQQGPLPTITDDQGVIIDGARWLRAAAACAAAADLHPRVVTGLCDEGGPHVGAAAHSGGRLPGVGVESGPPESGRSPEARLEGRVGLQRNRPQGPIMVSPDRVCRVGADPHWLRAAARHDHQNTLAIGVDWLQ